MLRINLKQRLIGDVENTTQPATVESPHSHTANVTCDLPPPLAAKSNSSQIVEAGNVLFHPNDRSSCFLSSALLALFAYPSPAVRKIFGANDTAAMVAAARELVYFPNGYDVLSAERQTDANAEETLCRFVTRVVMEPVMAFTLADSEGGLLQEAGIRFHTKHLHTLRQLCANVPSLARFSNMEDEDPAEFIDQLLQLLAKTCTHTIPQIRTNVTCLAPLRVGSQRDHLLPSDVFRRTIIDDDTRVQVNMVPFRTTDETLQVSVRAAVSGPVELLHLLEEEIDHVELEPTRHLTLTNEEVGLLSPFAGRGLTFRCKFLRVPPKSKRTRDNVLGTNMIYAYYNHRRWLEPFPQLITLHVDMQPATATTTTAGSKPMVLLSRYVSLRSPTVPTAHHHYRIRAMILHDAARKHYVAMNYRPLDNAWILTDDTQTEVVRLSDCFTKMFEHHMSTLVSENVVDANANGARFTPEEIATAHEHQKFISENVRTIILEKITSHELPTFSYFYTR